MTADSLWNAFRQIIRDAINMFVPSYVPESNKNSSELDTRYKFYRYPARIRRMMSRKRTLWKLHKQHPDNNVILYNHKMSHIECRREIMKFEADRETEVIENNNTGSFYKFVNKRLSSRGNIGMMTNDQGEVVHSNTEKADILNKYFTSTMSTDLPSSTMPDFPSRCNSDQFLDETTFTSDSVHRQIRNCRSKKSRDPDGFSMHFLKQIAPSISYPTSLLFNSLMSISTIPLDWKSSIVTPIHKKGPRTNPENYRAVSVTSIFSKLMERIVVLDILHHMQSHNLLSREQHGFLKKKSTLSNLLESLNDWTLSLENKLSETIVFIDFKRAFDLVPHDLLLHKLSSYNIRGNLLRWIDRFLSNRTQATLVNGSISSFQPVSSGVVQGSCLGPLLFLIYINDITDHTTQPVTSKLYADDLKLYSAISTSTDIQTFQDTLDRITVWSRVWRLPISIQKCCELNIGPSIDSCPPLNLQDISLPRTTSARDLGIIFDSCLNFDEHINTIVKKAHNRANLILKCFQSRNRQILIRAFTIYVRPLLEFNSPVWSPSLIRQINILENVQRSFTKRLPGLKNLTYHQRLKAASLKSLEYRRLTYDLTLTYKLVFGLINTDYKLLNLKTTSFDLRRHQYQLNCPNFKSSVRCRSFFYRITNIWNNLPASTNFGSLKSFTHSIPDIYLNQYLKVHFN